MTFNIQPFLDASLAVQIHVIAALFALFSGLYIFTVRKGTRVHRGLGKAWVVAMVIVAVSSFFIHQLRVWGAFSPIHLLSIFTLGSLAYSLWCIRRGHVRAHQMSMIGLFCGGILVAGTLALSRDLLMHRILLNGYTGSFIPSPAEWPGGPVVFALSCGALTFIIVFALGANLSRKRDGRSMSAELQR